MNDGESGYNVVDEVKDSRRYDEVEDLILNEDGESEDRLQGGAGVDGRNAIWKSSHRKPI